METKLQRVKRALCTFFREMELSDKIFLVLYGIFFTALGLLFEFNVLAKPVDWIDLLKNGSKYEYYILVYAALFISNIIMIAMAVLADGGLKNQIKWVINSKSGVYGYGYGYQDQYTTNSLLGSIVSNFIMIVINFVLYNTFIVINGIVLVLGLVMFLFVLSSK